MTCLPLRVAISFSREVAETHLWYSIQLAIHPQHWTLHKPTRNFPQPPNVPKLHGFGFWFQSKRKKKVLYIVQVHSTLSSTIALKYKYKYSLGLVMESSTTGRVLQYNVLYPFSAIRLLPVVESYQNWFNWMTDFKCVFVRQTRVRQDTNSMPSSIVPSHCSVLKPTRNVLCRYDPKNYSYRPIWNWWLQ